MSNCLIAFVGNNDLEIDTLKKYTKITYEKMIKSQQETCQH